MGKVLLEKEKSLLPYTQKEVSNELALKKIREEIKNLPSDKKLQKQFGKYYNCKDEYFAAKKIKDETKKKLLLKKEMLINKPQIKAQKNEFVGKCTVSDCKGYINKDLKCELCNCEVCPSCFVPKNEHYKNKCRIEDLQLREILKKDSKSCPKCYIPILKAGGCDQMWCTNCNTAFSWTTGQIEVGAIHNPHFYEWLANNTTTINVENIACGELPRFYELENLFSNKNYQIRKFMLNVHRMIIHIEAIVIPENYREDRVKDNVDLRVKYLLNTIDENQWMKTLIFRERKRMTNRAHRQVLEMFTLIATDLFRRLVVEKNLKNICKEMNQFIRYILDCFDHVNMLHGGSIPEHVIDIHEIYKYLDSTFVY
jgi:hypothetical protein